MVRQRHCRRLARNGKPAASLLTPSSSEPRTPAGKARVLDARKWLRERDGLSAGGRWIRTPGSARAHLGWRQKSAASGSTSALDGATRAQLGGAERTVARKWRKTGIFPPFRDAPRVKSVVWRNQVSSKSMG